jgi:hypothetical protein
MFSRRRRNIATTFSDIAFCRRQTKTAVVTLKNNGISPAHGEQSYLVTVGPEHDPYYEFSVNAIVDAYRTFLLVVALLESTRLDHVTANVVAMWAFHEKYRTQFYARLGATYDQIASMPIDDMPDSIKQEHRLRTTDGGRKG